MKRSIIMACALAIGSSLGMAEDKAASSGVSTSSPSTSQYQPEQMQLFDSSVIENKKITDSSGKNLGKLERLLIDSKSGQVRFAVVQVDKEWSLNDPEVIIPWRTLQISGAAEKDLALKIDADRDKLMNAPHFDKMLVHQLNTREAGQPIYTYWGVTWEDMPASSTSGTASTPASSNPSGTSASSSTSTTSTTPSPTSTTSSPSSSPRRGTRSTATSSR